MPACHRRHGSKAGFRLIQPDRGGYPIHPFLSGTFVFPIAWSRAAETEMNEAKTAYADARENRVAGRLDEAERLYREVLAIIPHHADSRHLLGVIAYQTGRHETAIRMINEAIAIDPHTAPYHCNLGIALYDKGLVDEAIISYRSAIYLMPAASRAAPALGRLANARRGERRVCAAGGPSGRRPAGSVRARARRSGVARPEAG